MNLITAFALASVVAAPVKIDPAEDVKKSLQGEWKMVAYSKRGSSDTNEQLADAKITIKGDKMEIHRRGRNEEATFTLDPKADPSAIDFKPQNEAKELMIKGIYKLEKDKLTICFGLEGTDRPKEFKSTEDSGTGMFVLERVKK